LNLNTVLKTDEIGIFALGGLGEVGKNTYVFEINNKIFIIDAGIMFPDHYLLGIDYVIPNYQYLIENESRIVGLFITHGHEDHIGGIPYLLKQAKIPKIYASGIAVDLIEHKLMEHKGLQAPRIIEYKAHHKFRFDEVEVSFVRLNHSIPDMFGIVIKTPHGNIFHTGDFKIDYTPVGPHAELDKLAKIRAKGGVLCLLSDSTNALIPGSTPSEKAIGESIDEIFQNIKGRIIIATFASNIYRMQQIVRASYLNGRKVAVVGRSMEKAMEIGIETGYIRAPKNVIIPSEEIEHYEPHQITILSTGSQGEPMAALSRIASGVHRQIKAQPNDTVIFSSSPIPGNQEGINRIIDLLYRKNVEVIINGPVADTHTSGHGAQNDLMLMLAITKPKFFIPMHGEHRMLKEHRELAISMGMKPENVLIMDNGDVAAVTSDKIKLIGKVPAGDVYIDGLGIGSTGSKLIRERKVLSEDGLLSVILSIENGELKRIPTVVSRGFIYMKSSETFINEIQEFTQSSYNTNKIKGFSEEKLKNLVETELQDYIYEATQRKPMIIASFITI
jgi:ribonuclease J